MAAILNEHAQSSYKRAQAFTDEVEIVATVCDASGKYSILLLLYS